MPALYTNLLTHNEEFTTHVFGDDVLEITHHVSVKHFIMDDASPSYPYSSYFTVRNKAGVALKDISVAISAGESPDQGNVQTQFRRGASDAWLPGVMIPVGALAANATSPVKHWFTIQIMRVLPGGALENWKMNTYLNPTYKISYDDNYGDTWKSVANVIAE